MKQFTACATNFLISLSDSEEGKPEAIPMVEVVLVTTETAYQLGPRGVAQGLKPDTYRFTATSPALRQLSENLSKWADELDQRCGAPPRSGLIVPPGTSAGGIITPGS